MATVASRGSGTPVTSGTTWATTTNAVDGAVGSNPATYATWTNATSGATGYIEISGHNFAATIGALDTINSVSISIRTLVSNTGRISAVSYRPYDGATPLDVVAGGTVTTTAHNNSANFTLTTAQLRSANFKVRITFTHAGNTQSGVASVDYADVTVDYTPLPPTITQAAYQFFDDAGTESGAAALAALNTAVTGDLTNGDGYGQIRVRLQSTNTAAIPATDDFRLQFEKNASGNWFDVTSTGVESLLRDYDQTNQTSTEALRGTTNRMYQTFLGDGRLLTKTAWYLGKSGAPTSVVTAELYTHTGTFGASGTPGTFLVGAETIVPATSLSTSQAWIEFTFLPYQLTNGTAYCTVISVDGGDASNYVTSGQDGTTPTDPGNQGTWNTSFWSASSWDAVYRVYTSTVASTVVPYDSPTLTESAATTNRLGAGTGSFTAGKVSEVGNVTNVGWAGNNYTELLYSVRLVAADLANGDTLRFRVVRNGSTSGITYTQTPTINITLTVVPPSTWENGSTGSAGVAGVSGAFTLGPAPQVWGLPTANLLEPFNNFTDNGWTFAQGTPTIVAGRTGTAAQISGNAQQLAYTISAPSDIVTLGCAFRQTGLRGGVPFEFFGDGGTVAHTNLQITSSGAIVVRRVTSVLGATADETFVLNTWYYLELQFKLHDTTGVVIVRLNGVDIINNTARDTRNAGTVALYDQLRLGISTSGGNFQYDDFYLTMGAGGTFLGDFTIPPTSPAKVGAAGVSGDFAAGPRTWTGGSTATIGVAATSGAFVLAAGPDQVWGGSEASTIYTLFHQTPQGTDSGSDDTDPGGVVVGTRVMFAEAGEVIGVWFQKGNPEFLYHTVTLWQQTGPGNDERILLASKTQQIDVTGWTMISFDAPVPVGPLGIVLDTPMSYVVACHYPQDPTPGDQQLNYFAISHGFDAPYVEGPITAPAGSVENNAYRNGRFIYTANGLSYPDGSFNNGNYLIDPEFSVPSFIVGWSLGTIGVGGISGAFTTTVPPQTWAGSTAAVGVAGLTGAFTAGTATWAGSTATVGTAGVSGSFAAGAVAWAGSTATAGVAGASGVFVAGAQAWAGGSTALVGVAATTGLFVAGTAAWAGSTAVAGVAGVTGTWVAGAITWGGAPPSTLDVLDGLAAWLDASELAQGYLAAWPNQGGGSEPIMIGTPLPFVMADTLNGMSVVRFSSGSGRLRGQAPTALTNLTLVYIVRRWGPSVGRAFTSTYPGTAAFNFLVGFHSSSEDWMYDNGAPYAAGGWNPAYPGAWKLYGADATDAPTYVSRFFIDGVQTGVDWPSGQGIGGTYNLSGYDATGPEETMDCEVAEFLLYDRKLSDVERVQVEDYLRTKWFVPAEPASDVATIGVAGVSGSFAAGAAPPQTWVGSTATVGAAGTSGTFVGGPTTWAGSTATVAVAATSGPFTPGVAAWAGSTATVGVAALSGLLIGGPTTWAGSTAMVGVFGATGNFSQAGAPLTWTGSTATVGVAGQTALFVPGARTWTGGSTATAGIAAVSGLFVPGVRTWSGSTATIGVAGMTSTWSTTSGVIGRFNGQDVVAMQWGTTPVAEWSMV